MEAIASRLEAITTSNKKLLVARCLRVNLFVSLQADPSPADHQMTLQDRCVRVVQSQGGRNSRFSTGGFLSKQTGGIGYDRIG